MQFTFLFTFKIVLVMSLMFNVIFFFLYLYLIFDNYTFLCSLDNSFMKLQQLHYLAAAQVIVIVINWIAKRRNKLKHT